MHELNPASVTELPLVATWIRSATEALLWAGHRITYPVDLSSLENDLEFTGATSWALFEAGSICAFGQVVEKVEGRRHLARLIVDPERRRSGLGRVLAEHLVRVAQDEGAIRISLNVDPSNQAALALYRSLEFDEAKRPDDEPASGSLYLEHAV